MYIRKVEEKDFDSVLDLHLQLEDTEITFDSNLRARCYETEEGKDKLNKRIHNKNNIFLVAINEDEQVIGFIDGSVLEDAWWYKEKVISLDYICVDKKYRRENVATSLFQAFEEQAKQKEIKHIRVLAFVKNIPATSFYKKHGFDLYSAYYNKKIK